MDGIESVKMDEWEQIRRCRAGSTSAFEPLVRRHEGRALAFAGSLLGDPDEAADVVQEAFVRAYRNLDRLEEGSRFGPWLRTILRNLCLDCLRSARHRREERWPESVGRELAREPRASDTVLRDELATRVMDAVAELDEPHRAVLVLRELEGLGYAEIADSLGIAEGTVASRLYHARRKLREILELRGVSPADLPAG